MILKICVECKKEKAYIDFAKNGKGQIRNKCKLCRNQENRKIYSLNPEKKLVKNKEWREKNPDKIKGYFLKHNPLLKNKLARKRWRDNNREKIKRDAKEYYLLNKNKRKEYHKKYRKENIDLCRAYKAFRRALEINATPSWVDKKEIRSIYKKAQKLFLQTGILYHVDHIVPLNGKNVCGLHVPWNLQVIPAVENLQKSNKYE